MANWTDLSTLNAALFPRVGTQVTITGSGGGSGAVIYAVTSGGVIVNFNIVYGGSGYSGTLTVTITGTGTGASATATQSGGVINAVTPVTGGTGYTNGAVAWQLNVPGNWVDTLVGYLANWPSPVNGNGQALSNLGPSAWTNLTLLNGWTAAGGANPNPSYMIDPFGIVHLRGAMVPGTLTNGTNIFNLPSGFRPAFETQVAAIADNGGTAAVALLVIATAGGVTYFYNGSAAYISLDGITFATF